MIRRLLIICLLILIPAAQGCHNDQEMIEKHEKTLAAEED